MGQKLTTEEFIKKAEKVHGDKYKYDTTVYTNARTKLEIFCVRCNKYFVQLSAAHLAGSGCPECGNVNKFTKEDFINKAIELYGPDLYDFSKVNYIDNRTKIKILCKNCNTYFLKTPALFLKGIGCIKCNKTERNKKKQIEFIKKAKNIHGSKYNYDSVEYEGADKKVKILCPTHGYFYQYINHHLNGCGCNGCDIDKRKLGREEFIKRAKEIHGDKYDYNKIVYINAATKVTIRCKRCSKDFQQLPSAHLAGCGHKACCSDIHSSTEYGKAHSKSYLYIVHMFGMDENFYKLGISKKGAEKRFRYLEDYDYEVWYEKQLSGYDARKTEIELHKLHKKYKYCPHVQFPGHTECFSRIDLPLIKQTIEEYQETTN